MQTADGVPYWKIALLHLDSIASTVVQKCIYWDTPEQCALLRHRADARRADDPGQDAGPARGGVHRRARPRRRGRRDADDRLDQPPRPRRALHRRVRGGDQGAQRRDAGPGPVRAARRPRPCSTRSAAPASTPSASTSRRSTPTCSQRVAAGKAQCGVEGYFRTWERAVEVFGRGRVTTYVILGMGERPRTDRGRLPAGDRDGRLPVRRAAAPGARDADGRRAAARLPTTSRRSTGRSRRCSPSTGSTTSRRRRAVRAARRARACRPGSACSRRRRRRAGAGSVARRRSAAALACRLRLRPATSAGATSRSAARCSAPSRACSADDDRDERDDGTTRCTPSA